MKSKDKVLSALRKAKKEAKGADAVVQLAIQLAIRVRLVHDSEVSAEPTQEVEEAEAA